MARIRSIKPEIRTSEKVNSWPVEIRYFWVMLWGYVDDYGKGRDNAKLIVADTYPLDDAVTAQDVETWMKVLAKAGVIYRYAIGGSRYFAVVNWAEHQKPSHPARSVIPDPPQDSGAEQEDSGNPRETFASTAVNGSPEQGAGSREQRAVEQGAGTAQKRGTRIPQPFIVNGEMRTWAAERVPGVNVDGSTERFVNYWRAKTRDATKLDWRATWDNWLLADFDKIARSRGKPTPEERARATLALADQRLEILQ